MTMALREEHIALTPEAFKVLKEYSSSIPTGTTIGKQWKKNTHAFTGKEAEWYLCEYVPHENPDLVGIDYKKIVIREAGLKVSDLNEQAFF